MLMERILFMAAFTPRSQAYAQALENADLVPEHVLLFGVPKQGIAGQSDEEKRIEANIGNLFMPDFSTSLEDTVRQLGSKVHKVKESNVNSDHIYNLIAELKPELIIYSGYGGQLVGKKLLDIGSPFLHLHSGWLPDYKGSTTIYYSWLNERSCAVSAIIMNEKIDAGEIVLRKRFDIPAENVDPDYVYDSVIRSDTLATALSEYMRYGSFNDCITQSSETTPYYIMHPLLKHITRLSTRKRSHN